MKQQGPVVLTPEEVEAEEYMCPWQVGGGYDSPPEYCDMEKSPKAEFCPKHERADEKMRQWEEQSLQR